jgi:hypothetical protein
MLKLKQPPGIATGIMGIIAPCGRNLYTLHFSPHSFVTVLGSVADCRYQETRYSMVQSSNDGDVLSLYDDNSA